MPASEERWIRAECPKSARQEQFSSRASIQVAPLRTVRRVELDKSPQYIGWGVLLLKEASNGYVKHEFTSVMQSKSSPATIVLRRTRGRAHCSPSGVGCLFVLQPVEATEDNNATSLIHIVP